MTHATRQYIPEVDILKFVLALVVAVFHLHWSVFSRGYLANEFFFLLSGFFLGRSLWKPAPSPSAIGFLRRKFLPIYPVVFASTAIAFAVQMILKRTSFSHCLSALSAATWEFLMLQESALQTGKPYNGPAWYLSAMLLSMAVLYPLFRRLRKTDSLPVVAICLSVFAYSALWHGCGGIVAGNRWAGICSYRTVRAFAGISLGVFLHEMVSAARAFAAPSRSGRFVFSGVGLSLLGGLAVLLFAPRCVRFPPGTDFLAIPGFFFLLFPVLAGFTFPPPPQVVPLAKMLGKASLYVYLNHSIVVKVVNRIHGLSRPACFLCFCVGVALSCLACAIGVRVLSFLCFRIRSKLFEATP